MGKFIVIFNDQINEIDVNGFSLMTEKEVENYENLATSITWDFIYPIGDSEILFSSGDDLLSRLEFKEISNEEYKILKKIFKVDFGTFINEDFLSDIVDEEEEYESIDEETDEEEEDSYNPKRSKRNDYDDNDEDDF